MVRYKIFKSQDSLRCRHFENGFKETIDSEALMKTIINECLYQDYKVIINGHNLIIKTSETKVIIEDYQSDLASNLLAPFKDKLESNHLPSSFCQKLDPSLYNRPTKKCTLNGIARKGVISLMSIAIAINILNINMKATIFEENEQEPYSYSASNEEKAAQDQEESMQSQMQKAAFETVIENETKLLYTEKIIDFIYKEKITVEQFSEYLTLLVDGNNPFNLGYRNEGEAFLKVCFKGELSYPEKFLMIMLKGGYTYEQLDYVCAGCLAEAAGDGQCYEDAYAVASTLLNRIHNDWYYNNYGANFYSQFTAPDQYSVTQGEAIYDYMGCIDYEGYHAVIDALYSGEPMHDYLEFRGHWVDVKGHYEQFVPNGNKFKIHLNPDDYVDYSEEEMTKDEVRRRVLALRDIIPEV